MIIPITIQWICLRSTILLYLGLLCHSLDFFIGFIVCNTVTNTNTVPLNQCPVIHNSLDVTIETSGNLMAKFNSNNVYQTAWWGSQWLLAQNARDQFTMFNQNLPKPVYIVSKTTDTKYLNIFLSLGGLWTYSHVNISGNTFLQFPCEFACSRECSQDSSIKPNLLNSKRMVGLPVIIVLSK